MIKQGRKTIVRSLYWLARHAASYYVAGPELTDALRVCGSAAQRGWSATVCPFNEVDESPDAICEAYRAAVTSISNQHLSCYLSIKPPSFNYDINRISELISDAKTDRIRIHFDSHGPETADSTFQLMEKALSISDNYYGCTLPSRWARSMEDALWAAERGLAVRVVKGQWADDTGNDDLSDERYFELVRLMCGKVRSVSVATHNQRLAKKCLSVLKASGTPAELEQLYGLPLGAASFAEAEAIPVRIYVPYGFGYLPYAISKMMSQPRILWWLVRDFARSGLRREALRH